MSQPNMEMTSSCGHYVYSAVPVYQQVAKHRILDQVPIVRDRSGSVGNICDQINNSLVLSPPSRPCGSHTILTSPIHPSVFLSPRCPNLVVDKLDISPSNVPRSPSYVQRNVSSNKSPIKTMRPPGKLTKNKKISKQTHPPKKPSRNPKKTVDAQMRSSDSSPDSASDFDSKLDSYFNTNSKRCITSSNTLADMSRPKLTHQEVHQVLSSAHPSPLRKLRNEMLSSHMHKFKSWNQILTLGMNVIVYGLGSKRELLETFRRDHLSDSYHLVINGFFPTLSLKGILTQISCDVIGSSATWRSISEHQKFIINQFHSDNKLPDFYIIVHNICGIGLQTNQAQLTLSQLAACRRIHFVASVDLIKGPLLWDQGALSRFRWVWQHCPTYAAYTDETSYENSFYVQQSGHVALSALVHVMASLTPNARSIFKLLSQQQSSAEPGTAAKRYTSSGVPFYDLYAMSRANFLVSSEQSLRAQLTEFRDHKLVKSRRGADGVEYLRVIVDPSTLKIYFEEHSEAL